MTGPCVVEIGVVQIIIAVSTGLGGLLTVWLTHRRRMADRERQAFEDIVLEKLGLTTEVADWHRRVKRRR